ncbi:hypothetical protein CLOM_g14600 [Closterium sp. NIES-68]|nr:hypothetical protein CLOM_g14600 [Closterium sp. NIES-68]GJP82443.1 hypothetical protein CLOP_g12702 [Closterium sp. NIES-67]
MAHRIDASSHSSPALPLAFLLLLVPCLVVSANEASRLPDAPCDSDGSQSAHFWWPWSTGARKITARRLVQTRSAEVTAAAGRMLATKNDSPLPSRLPAVPSPTPTATTSASSQKSTQKSKAKSPKGSVSTGVMPPSPSTSPPPKKNPPGTKSPAPASGGKTPATGGKSPPNKNPASPPKGGNTPGGKTPPGTTKPQSPKLPPSSPPTPKSPPSPPKNTNTSSQKPPASPASPAAPAKPPTPSPPPAPKPRPPKRRDANETVPTGPSNAVGSADCQYQGAKELAACAVGFAQTAGVRGGQALDVTRYTVESEYDTLDGSRMSVGSLRWAVTYLRDGAYIRFARSMEIVLQGNLFLRPRTTIDGQGFHVRITNGSIVIQNVNDVIVHNIEVSGQPRGDLIPIYNSSRVWVDHCRLYGGLTGTVDVGKGSTDVTISNSYVSSYGQTMQLGLSDVENADTAMRVTLYRNWFNASGAMQPLCRKGSCHIANNVYSSWGYYAIAARKGAVIRSERNFFRPDPAGRRKEVTPYWKGMPPTDGNYDSTVTIVSIDDFLAGNATFSDTAYRGPKPVFTPPYALTFPKSTRNLEAWVQVNAGPKYDALLELDPPNPDFLPPAPSPPPAPDSPPLATPPPAPANGTEGNGTAAPPAPAPSPPPPPPESPDCQYAPGASRADELAACAVGFAAAGLAGGNGSAGNTTDGSSAAGGNPGNAGRPVYVVTLDEDFAASSRQGSLRWGISNFARTGAVFRFARDMTIQLAAPLYVKSQTTIDARGRSVNLVGDSLLVQHASGVIIHNIEMSGSVRSPAHIALYNSTGVWIDHCRFTNTSTSSGAIELARNSTGVTISNCHFSSNQRGFTLHLGQADGDNINSGMNVTVYRNWFDGSASPAWQPMCRLGLCHVANNLYTAWTADAMEARVAAQVLLEQNQFVAGPASRQVVGNTTAPVPGLVAAVNNTLLQGTDGGAVGSATAATWGPVYVAVEGGAQVFVPPYALDLAPLDANFTAFVKANAGPHAK